MFSVISWPPLECELSLSTTRPDWRIFFMSKSDLETLRAGDMFYKSDLIILQQYKETVEQIFVRLEMIGVDYIGREPERTHTRR